MDSVSQEQKALFLPLFQARMAKFMKLSPELQAKGMELYTKSLTDPAYKVQIDAETEATFKAADTDGNGVLNKATFQDFSEKMALNNKAKMGGDDSMQMDNAETIGKWFDALNTLSPDADGILLADYHKMWDIGKALMAQMGGKKE